VENFRAALESQNPLIYSLVKPMFDSMGLESKSHEPYLADIGKTFLKSPYGAVGIRDVYPARSAAEEMMSTIMAARGRANLTHDKLEVKRFKIDFVDKIKRGKVTEEDWKKAVQVGAVMPNGEYAKDIEAKLATTSGERMFKILTPDEASMVYQLMTPKEQAKYEDLFTKKMDNAEKKEAHQ
jgi:hypothetical protein